MKSSKKILIIDEDGFSEVCSAILRDDGYQTELVKANKDAIRKIPADEISLIVSSYPYGTSLLKPDTIKDIPLIILSDEVNNDLLALMKKIKHSVCMVKPLDFQRLRYLVCGIVNGYTNLTTGGHIIA